MNAPLALIIDDEPDILELLELTLGRMEIPCRAANNVAQAHKLLTQHPFQLCLTDMRLPDGDGIELVKHIQQRYPNIPVAVITAHGSMELAINALKAGAFDFVSKPVDLHVLRNLVNTALKLSSTTGNAQAGSHKLTLLGESAIMQATRATIKKLARSQAPVYIRGESGTGKELVARMIHEKGPRADKPFVPVNCGAIPTELMEGEFFGHKKGSFSGAIADKAGLFQAANGGTLFLDEVADLPLHMQVKLLRAIQEKSIRPIGAQQEIPTDVRILSATHKDLAALVEKESFRQDLYYRINVIEVLAPSLRERPEDIPMLATHFLHRLSQQIQIAAPTLSLGAMKALLGYTFPGNVRELENILERAMTLCENSIIEAGDLHLCQPQPGTTVTGPAESPAIDVDTGKQSLEPYLDEVEKERIVKALEQTRYNKTAAAKLLGISFGALRYRLKKLGLD
ncbi:MAG: sigma-54-dependent Fis family transcriptional regulator [Gammaproteobacteria bacterium]|nr:sigma-54-dependent Fis family transcriptional regulator [Gammaproteobacteria bacterium]